jgi:hypothetical protein
MGEAAREDCFFPEEINILFTEFATIKAEVDVTKVELERPKAEVVVATGGAEVVASVTVGRLELDVSVWVVVVCVDDAIAVAVDEQSAKSVRTGTVMVAETREVLVCTIVWEDNSPGSVSVSKPLVKLLQSPRRSNLCPRSTPCPRSLTSVVAVCPSQVSPCKDSETTALVVAVVAGS